MRFFIVISSLVLTFTLGVGCSSDPVNTNSSSSSSSSGSGGGGSGGGAAGGGGSGGGGSTAICTEPTVPIACEDKVFQLMDLKNNVAPGLITEEKDGNGFWSTIDARAGGFTPTDSYVYAKFADTGLVKVDMTDEQSVESMNWDIAFRRFVIRINSGNSGPSCVQAALMKNGTDYDGLASVPADATFRSDEYFSMPNCELIPDKSGLGSPATVLSDFWTYGGCVQMTGNVYVLRKADGSTVKLTITDYYAPAAQEQCNTMGSVPMQGSGAATIRMRWAFVP